MGNARLAVIIVAVCIAVGVAYFYVESSKTRAYSWEEFEFAKNGSQQANWDNVKPQLKYMPSLPPDTAGLVIADIDTFVPRHYFDTPPPLRFAVPVHHGNATVAAMQAASKSD